MPRDSNGNYTLPSGNPVVTGEVISTGWANPTMSDIGAELTNSLDRQGRGGMLAPFKFVDGTNSQPGMTWTNEPTTGFYRAGGADMRATVAGVARMRWTGTGVDVYDSVAGTWVALANASGTNFAVKNADNKFSQDQTIVKASTAWAIWKDATPTLGARFAFNIDAADALSLARFNGSSWISVFNSDVSTSRYDANEHIFRVGGGATQLARFAAGTFSFGPGNYDPATPAVKYLGMMTEGSDTAVVGCYNYNVTNNARAELFAGGTACGINWSFGNGVAAFEFRRVGTTIFTYNENGIDVYYAKWARFFDSTNSYATILNQNGTSLDIAASGSVQTRFLTQNVMVGNAATAQAFLHVERGNGGSVANDVYINRFGGAGTNEVGQNTWMQLFNSNDGRGAGLQLLAAGGFSFWRFDGSGWTANGSIDNSGLTLNFSGSVWLGNSSNSAYTRLSYMGDSGGANQLQVASRGAAWHWYDAVNSAGDIQVGTVTPSATGRVGSLFLVYE